MLSTVIRMFLLGTCTGALAAHALHEPPRAPLPAVASAAPIAGDASPVPLAVPAPRAGEFTALEDRIATTDQALQRVRFQLQQQDLIYQKQKPSGAVFDEAFWKTRQDSLLAEKVVREDERAQLESEYQRYRCDNNRYRAECWR